MDDGYVIPRLNENWTFAGATPMEWISGLMAGIIAQELFFQNMGRNMPFILMIIIGTPIIMATIRKTFPDEERGVRNCLMVKMGIKPTDIPEPSVMQPVWSGLPMREMNESREFVTLGLEEVLLRSFEK